MDWKNKRVIIIGAGRQGTSLARYLSEAGAQVVLTDKHNSEALSVARRSLSDLSIEWILGEHPIDLLDNADLVCPSGGVPLSIPFIKEAIKREIPLSNDSQIFIESTEAKVIGITGSAGKTTTTTLFGRMAEQSCLLSPKWREAFIGGNIGHPLLNEIAQIETDDLVVMELSSFQLEIMTVAPHIAAILNITPNHLDRHITMEAYTNAKLNILKYQKENGISVLPRENTNNFNINNKQSQKLLSFGFAELDKYQYGSFVRDEHIWLRDTGSEFAVIPISNIELKGKHNLLNVLAAITIASAAGLPIEAMKAGIKGFTGVEHRLEFIRKWGGAAWYNDSIATAPERTIAAIRSFNDPIMLLLGGRDKNLPWLELSELCSERVSKIILFGEAAPLIKRHLSKFPGNKKVFSAKGLDDAVKLASDKVEQGEVVLLSPGGTSFDEFTDFAERGLKFKELVYKL